MSLARDNATFYSEGSDDVMRWNVSLRRSRASVDNVHPSTAKAFRFRDKAGEVRTVPRDDLMQEIDELLVPGKIPWDKGASFGG